MNVNVKYWRFLCLAVCITLLGGCGRKNGSDNGDYGLYYVDTEEPGIVKEYCEVTGTSAEEQIDKMLAMLQEGPQEIQAGSAFVKNVTVSGWELDEGKLKLHFSEEYSELNTVSELFLRAAVVQSLTQIDGVEYVAFYIGDTPLTDDRDREIGYMNEESFVQNIGSSLHSYQIADLTLYFANETGDKLVQEKVKVRYNSNTSMEKLIVEQLMKGPRNQKDKSTIPMETKVLGVSVKDKVCYVNFDEGFLTMTEQGNPRLTVYSIVNSIIDATQVSQVQILVNGETNIVYQENVDLSKPLTKNLEIIETEEE